MFLIILAYNFIIYLSLESPDLKVVPTLTSTSYKSITVRIMN